VKKDRYHDTVVKALKKDRWTITKKQVALRTDFRILFIDLEATNNEHKLVILIEIKGSENENAEVHEFYNAVGQYLTYRALLDSVSDKRDLYLAIPETAYKGIFTQDIGHKVLEEFQIRLIVFKAESEEIIKWINPLKP